MTNIVTKTYRPQYYEEYHDKFVFIPLGGTNEVGMNINLYHHPDNQGKGQWLIVDLGIGFADNDFPGVEIILPDITFIEKHKDQIVGLVLTHAHEDHIGAVPYLWNKLRCPIYTTEFTAAVLKAKFREMSSKEPDVVINIIEPNTRVPIGLFSVEMIYITHSIPEMHGIMIRTPSGNIFNTGDWKLDPNPIVGPSTDEVALKAIGDEGVLAMIGDSTNIFNRGTSGSEGDLTEQLKNLIKRSGNMIIVTTFASNIARLHSIAVAAKAVNRKVVMVGRSLWRMYNAALSCGYLSDLDPILEIHDIKSMQRKDVLLICTGCQGEPEAAIRKITDEVHDHVKVEKGDTIIFSSKVIPGNEKRIFAIFDKLTKMGVNVLNELTDFVHVSGHPAQDEVKRMYEMIKPKIAIPVHGDATRLDFHAKFAKSIGIKHAIEVENGAVVFLNENTPGVIGKVHSGYVGIDGKYIIGQHSNIYKERKEMRDNGIVFIIINCDGKGVKYVRVFGPGILDSEKDKNMINAIIDIIKTMFSNNNIKNLTEMRSNVNVKKIALRIKSFLQRERGKKPRVIIHFV
jgi:ribonuclease J